MKNFLSLLSLVFSSIFSSSVFAANGCKVFVNFENSASPEPTPLDCGDTSKNMNECNDLCLKVAFSKCPNKTATFQGSTNFNNPHEGFEAATINGNCAEAPKTKAPAKKKK